MLMQYPVCLSLVRPGMEVKCASTFIYMYKHQNIQVVPQAKFPLLIRLVSGSSMLITSIGLVFVFVLAPSTFDVWEEVIM